jgi:hypothetical protein
VFVGYVDRMKFIIKKYHFSKIIIPNEHNICCIILIDIVEIIISFHIGFIPSISHSS